MSCHDRNICTGGREERGCKKLPCLCLGRCHQQRSVYLGTRRGLGGGYEVVGGMERTAAGGWRLEAGGYGYTLGHLRKPTAHRMEDLAPLLHADAVAAITAACVVVGQRTLRSEGSPVIQSEQRQKPRGRGGGRREKVQNCNASPPSPRYRGKGPGDPETQLNASSSGGKYSRRQPPQIPDKWSDDKHGGGGDHGGGGGGSGDDGSSGRRCLCLCLCLCVDAGQVTALTEEWGRRDPADLRELWALCGRRSSWRSAGCSHRTATNGIESYDPRADRWVAVATDREEAPCGYHGIVVLHGSVYHVGGFDGVDFCNTMRRLDLATRRWHAAAPMHERRGYVCVAVVGGGFYATGGHNGHRRLSGVERYLPDGNQRTRVASMCHAARQVVRKQEKKENKESRT
ncbi:hypothetical protein CRUP_036896 [Coryphaenoides rupestris]|nr:hypothetical protein CRUP_036896 [Coryphaenoides rupestris]